MMIFINKLSNKSFIYIDDLDNKHFWPSRTNVKQGFLKACHDGNARPLSLTIKRRANKIRRHPNGEINKMKITKHAEIRMQQRGFSDFVVTVIHRFGREEKAPDGSIRIILGKREHQQVVGEFKRMIQMLDKAKGGKIVSCNDEIITVYK